MPDEIDASTEQAEKELNKLIARRPVPYSPLNLSGVCFHCGKKTGQERRWCNVQCRDAWELNRL